MLVKFSISNFLSYNKKQTFTLESGRVTKKSDHLLTDNNTGKSLLHFAAIYGKNGAGKSNFIKAASLLKTFIVSGKLPPTAGDLWCKIEDTNQSKPTEFEIEFIADGILYEYNLSIILATGVITKDELIRINGNRKTKLYYKNLETGGYTFHNSIKGHNRDLEVLSRTFAMSGSAFLFSINHNTQGFYAANPQAIILRNVFLWFMDTLEVIFPDQSLQQSSLLQYEISKSDFEKLLKDFDTGIEGIRLENVTKEKVFENIDFKLQQQVNLGMALVSHLADFAAINNQLEIEIPLQESSNIFSQVVRTRRNIFIINLEKDAKFHFYSLKFIHNIGGKKLEFTMQNESDGTYRLFQLIEILVCKKDKVFIMDEINRSLHPKLTVQFVKKYFEHANGRKVQLVTTTHESRIMSHDIVRRDEIWICDKNDDSSTKMYSLEDEQVRIDKVLDENYMNNVWGGVPVFEDE